MISVSGGLSFTIQFFCLLKPMLRLFTLSIGYFLPGRRGDGFAPPERNSKASNNLNGNVKARNEFSGRYFSVSLPTSRLTGLHFYCREYGNEYMGNYLLFSSSLSRSFSGAQPTYRIPGLYLHYECIYKEKKDFVIGKETTSNYFSLLTSFSPSFNKPT